ncbi:MAG: RidA family protein [Actinomycetota bacterium]
MTTPHDILNPETLTAPIGFSHAVVASPGRTIYLGGQTAHDVSGAVVGDGIVEQFAQAASNVATALAAAGAQPEHLVSMQIYITDLAAYRNALDDLAPVYRAHFGRHYPASALFEVSGLLDPAALVELVCIAVVP